MVDIDVKIFFQKTAHGKVIVWTIGLEIKCLLCTIHRANWQMVKVREENTFSVSIFNI